MLTVITCTKDRKNILLETLERIFSFPDIHRYVSEFIVVNDGSDDLEKALGNYPVRVIRNHGKGLAAGRNTGASHASSSHMLFLDDDILVNADHFKKHWKHQQGHENRLVTANRFYPEALIRKAEKTPFGRYKLNHEYNWLAGCELRPVEGTEGLFHSSALAGFSCSMSRSMWEKCGGFNETFPHAGCEDNEFFIRTREHGSQLFFDETNICYHNELDNFTLGRWIRRQASGIKGALIICALHPEGKMHPTYYLNTPVRKNDDADLKKTKSRRILLSEPFILKGFYAAIAIAEKLHLPDRFIFRLYNAVWLGESKKSFMEEYNKGLY